MDLMSNTIQGRGSAARADSPGKNFQKAGDFRSRKRPQFIVPPALRAKSATIASRFGPPSTSGGARWPAAMPAE
jgi:hypothetical protein